LTWFTTAHGGAVATTIVILAALAEFLYIPTTWDNASHLTRRLILILSPWLLRPVLLSTLSLVELAGRRIPRSHSSYCPVYFNSTGATLVFGIMPSVECLATGSQASRVSTPRLIRSRPVIRSYVLKRAWGAPFTVFAFICKFTESYFNIKDELWEVTDVRLTEVRGVALGQPPRR
jgi:1,3-beta-glucan synthase